MAWNRKAAINWAIDQIENKLSGIYNTIDALFYLQGSTFVNQCNEIVDVPTFSNKALTERQQKLFINKLAKHIDGITWEEYQAYKTEREAETQAIIEARKQVKQNITNGNQENSMTTTTENHEETTQNNINSNNKTPANYLQYFAATKWADMPLTTNKEAQSMSKITPTTALLALTKIIKRTKDAGHQDAIQRYYGTRNILVWIDSADWSNNEHYNALKNILFILEKHGYIKSAIGENVAITGYKKIQGKIYKERQWRITSKGIEKVKKLVKQTQQN
jgi:hypothetical protein